MKFLSGHLIDGEQSLDNVLSEYLGSHETIWLEFANSNIYLYDLATSLVEKQYRVLVKDKSDWSNTWEVTLVLEEFSYAGIVSERIVIKSTNRPEMEEVVRDTNNFLLCSKESISTFGYVKSLYVALRLLNDMLCFNELNKEK